MYAGTVNVLNEAKLPILSLSVRYWQDFGGGKQNEGRAEFHRVDGKNPNPLFTFQMQFDGGHDIYWVIAWQNVKDPAVYYLVKEFSFWHKLEEDVIKGLDDAIGDAIDVATDSELGSAAAKATNYFVDKAFEQGKGSAKIENKINRDPGKNHLEITLDCDRLHAKLDSPGHHTRCDVKFYVQHGGNGDPCNK